MKPIATLCIDTSVAFPRKRESSTAAARPQPLTSGASAAPLGAIPSPARRRDRDFEAHHQHACPRQPRGRLRHRGEFWLAAGASALFGSTLFSFELNMVAPSTSRIASPAASTTPISTVFSVPVLRVLPSTGLSGIVRLHAPRLDACTTVPTSRGSKIRAIKACRTTRLRPIAPTLRRSTALGQAVACKMC